MDDISCLENLESLLTSKFKDHLSFRISETGSKPFLIISQFKPTDLSYVPSFHLVVTPLHDESLFMLKLLSFHGKVLEESVIDLTKDENSQFDLIHEFENDNLALCRGILKHGKNEPQSFNNFLLERLEEDIVLRSLNCSYVLRRDSKSRRQICDFCQNLNDLCKNSENEHHLSNGHAICLDEENVSDVLVKAETMSNVLETVNTVNEEVKSEGTSTLLQKLKSLNLPVTVSLSANLPSKLKVRNEQNDNVALRKSISEHTTKSKNTLSTIVVKKKHKRENAIELTGKTVTNRCSWCGSVFHRLYLFKDHLKVCSKAPKPVSKPSPIPRSAKNKPILSKPDVALEHEPYSFKEQCKICLHVYTNHARFVHDMRQHRKQLKIDLDSPVTCPSCQEQVEKRLLLNDHYSSRHPDPENGSICCDCFQVMPPEKLKYHFYYKHHMQQVDKKHLCPLCGKSLTYAYQLQVHMAVHHKSEADPNTGSLPTSNAKNLESEVMCDQCGKVFAHRALLCVHVRKQHIRSKAFPCDFCSKAFNAPGALLEHLGSVHLKLKPYKCRECDYLTSHKNNIYKHFQQHHGRKGNSDDVETISEIINELKQYIKKTENAQSN